MPSDENLTGGTNSQWATNSMGDKLNGRPLPSLKKVPLPKLNGRPPINIHPVKGSGSTSPSGGYITPENNTTYIWQSESYYVYLYSINLARGNIYLFRSIDQ